MLPGRPLEAGGNPRPRYMVAAPKGVQNSAYTPARDIFYLMLKSAMKKWAGKVVAGGAALCLVASLAACQKDEAAARRLTPSEARPVGKRIYGPIEPTVLRLPDKVIEALGGADIDGNPVEKTYIYFKTLTLVVYRDSFDVKDYIEDICAALGELAPEEEFRKAADVWVIQMQKRGTSSFVTLAVNPRQAEKYSRTRSIEQFLREADYLMISDRIISPEKRLDLYRGKVDLRDLSPRGEDD